MNAVAFPVSTIDTGPWLKYKHHRLYEPVAWCTSDKTFELYKYSDIKTVLSSKDYVVEFPFRVTRLVFGETLLDIDGPRHRHLRQFLAKLLGEPETDAYFRDCVDSVVDKCLNRIEGNKQIDFVTQFAKQVPPRVTCAFLGLPECDAESLLTKIMYLSAYLGREHDDISGATEIRYEVDDYLRRALSDRTVSEVSLIHKLKKYGTDPGVITAEESLRMLFLSLAGGTETSVCAFGNTMLCLLDNPIHLRNLETNPAAANDIARESLRLLPPQHHTVRFATSDQTIRGVKIGKGQALRLYLASANRDDEYFPDPDMFMPERRDAESMAFGFGIHACLGRKFGTFQLERSFEKFFRRFSNIAFAGNTAPEITGNMFNRPTALPVTFEAKKGRGHG